MANQVFSGLFNLILAIALGVSIYRARRDKQLKITFISDPMTTVEKVTIKGKGLTIAIVGFGISATLFTFSGLSAIFSYPDMGAHLLITFGSGFLFVITMFIARYVSSRLKG